MPPLAFVFTLLLLNLGASVDFACQRNWPFALIYLGGAIIQIGTVLWLR